MANESRARARSVGSGGEATLGASLGTARHTEEVIAAIATPPGQGGIGIVRLSGGDLSPYLAGIVKELELPARYARVTRFFDGAGCVIDEGLALYFPAPHSFTGENVLELHGHGGPVVMRLLLARCLELGARLAEPGEFTRRAFLNDRIDLAQAEAVADLIEATTATAARAAARNLSGEFSTEIGKMVSALTELRAFTEATLDFPEEDIEFLRASDAGGRLQRLRAELDHLNERSRAGSLLRQGLHVVLIGQPNVGKSSLLNRLAGEDLAIVTAVAGTTRDVVRGQIAVRGVPLHVIDTAGLRDAQDEIEQMGIERTWRAIEKADLAVLVVDERVGMNEVDARIAERLPTQLARVVVHNKIDLLKLPQRVEPRDEAVHVYLSAKTGAGLDLLEETILRAVDWRPNEGDVFLARERHLQALEETTGHLGRAAAHLESMVPPLELFAEELRLAQTSLGRITGAISADQLLGEIFSRFCIGK